MIHYHLKEDQMMSFQLANKISWILAATGVLNAMLSYTTWSETYVCILFSSEKLIMSDFHMSGITFPWWFVASIHQDSLGSYDIFRQPGSIVDIIRLHMWD